MLVGKLVHVCAFPVSPQAANGALVNSGQGAAGEFADNAIGKFSVKGKWGHTVFRGWHDKSVDISSCSSGHGITF